MPPMPPAELEDGMHHIRPDQVAAERMVSSHLPAHADQEKHFHNVAASPNWNLLQCDKVDQAQTDAGDVGMRPRQVAIGLGSSR